MSLKELAPSFYNRMSNLAEAAGSGKKFLEIGCSDGLLEEKLQKKFTSLTGIDTNASDIEIAGKSGIKNAEFLVADAEKLPFKNSTFDKIICSEVLEHVDDDAKAIREMHRVLKAGGKVIITVPQKKYPFTFDPVNAVLEALSGKHLPLGVYGYGDKRAYDYMALKRLFEKNGFEIIEERFLSHYFLGLCENYLSQILQPLVKTDYSNRASSGRAPAIRRDKKPPKALAGIRDFIIAADEKLFRNSRTSIDIMIIAQKKKSGGKK